MAWQSIMFGLLRSFHLLAMTVNFAILNLVKSFLTSIKFTFDNLSRKIKNPCLVINKNSFFKEEIIMYNFKKLFTYMVVGALVMALSISCKNDETNPNAGKFKHSDLVGTWTGDAGSFTINSSGYVNFTYHL